MPVDVLNGIDICWDRRGRGAPLLAITGTSADLRKSSNIFETPLPRHFDVASFDQRGLGRSAKPPAPYRMEDYAADALALLDRLDWPRAHVLGISFGGMVAQHLALAAPDRIDRLVLACSSPGGEGGASYPLHEYLHLTPRARAEHMIPISDTRCDARWRLANPEAHAAMVERLADDPFSSEPFHEEGQIAQLRARAGHDVWARLHDLKMPVLICGGRYDGIAPPIIQENLMRRISSSRLHFYEGGHLFLQQDSSAYRNIMAFLSGDDVGGLQCA